MTDTAALQQLAAALMHPNGACRECRMGITFHHPRCETGRLIPCELWERLKLTIRSEHEAER